MTQEHQIIFGPFQLEVPQGRLWRGDEVIPLRPRSLALLHYLAAHPGRVVTKVEVHQHVWAALGDLAVGPRYFIMPNPRLLAVSANVPTTSIRY